MERHAVKKKQVRYYDSFNDDFEQSANQNIKLPESYRRLRHDIRFRLLSGIIYPIALIIGTVYCRCVLHMRIHGRRKLKSTKGECFIYGNHTQPFGDVFIPALCAFPKRIYTVVSPANFGIPIIGKILPYLGALPTADSLTGLRDLENAIQSHVSDGHPIIIYPEAHVWKYYTEIRPFADTSFRFPVRCDKPVFTMTAVYREKRCLRRPVTDIFIDGPFFSTGDSVRARTASLHAAATDAMKKRSLMSNTAYIEYIKK